MNRGWLCSPCWGFAQAAVFAVVLTGPVDVRADVLETYLTHSRAPNTHHSIVYSPRDGHVFVTLPPGTGVFGFESFESVFDPNVTQLSLVGSDAPAQADTAFLAWFNATGLTGGFHDLGPIFPPLLTVEQLCEGFSASFSCVGDGCAWIIPVGYLIPEPATTGMTFIALAAICLRRRDSPKVNSMRRKRFLEIGLPLLVWVPAMLATRPAAAFDPVCPRPADVQPTPLPNALPFQRALLYYHPISGNGTVVLGGGHPVVGILSEDGIFDPHVTSLATLAGKAPAQADTQVLAWADFTAGLDQGIYPLGPIFPPGLDGLALNQQFRFSAGGAVYASCELIQMQAIPEPSIAPLIGIAAASCLASRHLAGFLPH
jgi:hypothetical protein